jgi:toxin FitB
VGDLLVGENLGTQGGMRHQSQMPEISVGGVDLDSAQRAVALGELTKWTVLRSWGPRKLADLAQWRTGIVVLPFDEAVATTWGHLQARAQQRGRPRPMNDSWIAACCLVDRLPLATFNGKDFADFGEYDGLRLFDVS